MSREGRNPGQYQVWHANDHEAVSLSQMEREPYVHGYTLVAIVQADDVNHAFELTNRDEWTSHEGVAALTKNPRPTAAGDIVIGPQGHGYLIEAGANPGTELFRQLQPSDGKWPKQPSREKYEQFFRDAAEPAHRAQYQRRDPDRGQER